MNIIHTTRPTPRQKEDMEQLIKTCKKKEPLSLSAPVDDDLEYDIFLLYERDSLSAMAFLFSPAKSPWECCAFVEPSKRRKGYFTRLLDQVLDFVEQYEKSLSEPADFCFLVDERTPSAVGAMEAIGAEYWYSEHKMERSLTPKDREYVMESLVIKQDKDHLYLACLKDKVIGTCALLPSQDRFYLYAFQIHEAYQGQGYGTQFLLGMLALAAATGTHVSLQVSGQNYIARNLYKKTGFRTTESLSYYLY